VSVSNLESSSHRHAAQVFAASDLLASSATPAVAAVLASLGALASPAALAASAVSVAQPAFVQNGAAGFVMSELRYALADDAGKTGACRRGMSLNVAEIFAATPAGKRHKGESDKDYGQRLEQGGSQLATAPNGQNLCLNPEAGKPDPNFHTVDAADIRVDGIDLDGADTSAGAPLPRGVCKHQDFVGMRGEPSVDNQFYRVVGCSRSFQSTGMSNSFGTEMLTGSWGILITLSGVDDIHNDDDVTVGLYANADPIQLSIDRKPLPYATYAMDQDPRFRATTHGRIKNGVLTTDPVDFRFHNVVNSLRLERPLQHARLQATLSEDGVLTGYFSGYTPVEAMYDFQYGYRNGKNGAGQLAPLPLRLLTANGAARVLGHTCTGAYYALYQYADGDQDPQTGRCTSISTQYRFSAIPAFVVDVATESSNAKLIEKAKAHAK
jgi:hypothetical protein